ncbi:hypothetical protein GcM1_186030 [Golovinomyces cichoracearum]|uniref:Secreted effector protein n=1 Tax=Golovinomyces cichoracearum TaxID=62708 RepID=A0A420J2Z4_9PEZI|nr:hypothetical protein GcM1_186030 [Golovinomyces cichoracearum]
MQFSTSFITLSLLGPLVSVAAKQNTGTVVHVSVSTSYNCGTNHLFSQPILRNDVTKGCSIIKSKYGCNRATSCVPGLRAISRYFSRVRIYNGPKFRDLFRFQEVQPTFYEYELNKYFLINAHNRKFYAVMENDSEAEQCSLKGLLMRSKGKENECTRKLPQSTHGPSQSPPYLRGLN